MEKHVVIDWPLLIPAGTTLKMSERDTKIRAHFLEFLDDGIVKATKPFQLKIGTVLHIDKGLFRSSKKGVLVAQSRKKVSVEQAVNNDKKGKQDVVKNRSKFDENLSRGLSNKTAVRGGQ